MTDLLVQGPGADEATLGTLCGRVGRPCLKARGGGARFQSVARTEDLSQWCEAACLDWAWVEALPPAEQFRLLAMDMDSTLITIECIDELARLAGVGTEVSNITAAAMRGELDFAGALRRRVGLLAGLPVTALDEVYEHRLRLSPGAESLLKRAGSLGWRTLLVSGGFTFFAERIGRSLGFDFTLANDLEIRDGALTGCLLGAIVDADAKARRLAEACAALGCEPRHAIAIGDGANDLKMLGLAGFSVAFRAKPAVRRQAHAALNHLGLDGVFGFLD